MDCGRRIKLLLKLFGKFMSDEAAVAGVCSEVVEAMKGRCKDEPIEPRLTLPRLPNAPSVPSRSGRGRCDTSGTCAAQQAFHSASENLLLSKCDCVWAVSTTF